MANLTRYKQKIFANNSNQVGVFGTGTDKVASKNVETLQSADYEDGWSSAIVTNKNYPVWQERDGVDYGFSYQLAYLLQKGIPEWLSTETYYQNDYCKVGNAIYYSLQDNNVGHNPSNTSGYWSIFASSSRNIGEIVPSTIPLTDAGLHLLDGTLLSGDGSYAQFVDYIADLYDSGDYTAIFDTEANWQTSVTQYGVCGKFVYDSVNNTVRLPKYGNQIWAGGGNAPVVGNGSVLGLKNVGVDSYNVDFKLANTSFINYLDTSTAIGSYTGTGANAYNYGVDTDGSKSGIIADLANITTALDCYYYIVIATTTKTSIEVDIDEIATDLNGKMDTDGTNATSSVGFADGQWVYSYNLLASGVTYPTSTDLEYSVATLLPQDNYQYEVLVGLKVITSSTSGKSVWGRLYTDITTSGNQVCCARTRTSSTMDATGSIILSVGAGRKVVVQSDPDANGTFNLYITGYRRIGTNV